MRLNLGCGRQYLHGYTNVDISFEVKTDMRYDIRHGIDEEDNSVDEIIANGVLEQMEQKDFKFVLNECHRVLRERGVLKGQVPSIDPRVLHYDPWDKLFFQPDSFNYFCKHKHHWQEFGRNYGFEGWEEGKAEINQNGIIEFELIK